MKSNLKRLFSFIHLCYSIRKLRFKSKEEYNKDRKVIVTRDFILNRKTPISLHVWWCNKPVIFHFLASKFNVKDYKYILYMNKWMLAEVTYLDRRGSSIVVASSAPNVLTDIGSDSVS